MTPGNNVTFAFTPDDNSILWVKHDCPNHPFGGTPPYSRSVALPIGGNGWTQVSKNSEPLSITPSILSDCCGIHGFITNGKWVSA